MHVFISHWNTNLLLLHLSTNFWIWEIILLLFLNVTIVTVVQAFCFIYFHWHRFCFYYHIWLPTHSLFLYLLLFYKNSSFLKSFYYILSFSSFWFILSTDIWMYMQNTVYVFYVYILILHNTHSVRSPTRMCEEVRTMHCNVFFYPAMLYVSLNLIFRV